MSRGGRPTGRPGSPLGCPATRGHHARCGRDTRGGGGACSGEGSGELSGKRYRKVRLTIPQGLAQTVLVFQCCPVLQKCPWFENFKTGEEVFKF